MFNNDHDALMQALSHAGVLGQDGRLLRTPHEITACIVAGVHHLPEENPWGEPFGLIIGRGWVSLDAHENGNVQARLTENGMQLRLRSAAVAACMVDGHQTETCDNCWTVSVLTVSQQWHPVTTQIQIRAGVQNDNPEALRVEVRRRTAEGEPQIESVWSEPWPLPGYSVRDNKSSWVNATPQGDVQATSALTSWGLLVRRATGRSDKPWTTESFVGKSADWTNVLADGTLQCRYVKGQRHRVELRQKSDRKPHLAVEPTWSASKSSHNGASVYVGGHLLQLARNPNPGVGSYSPYSVIGIRVTSPSGHTSDHRGTNRYLLVTPTLRVHVSTQANSFWWEVGTYEEPVPATTWSMPERRVLCTSEWTMLNNVVRAQVTESWAEGVRLEVHSDGQWLPLGRVSFGSTHHVVANLRVTFHTDHVAEVQHAVAQI